MKIAYTLLTTVSLHTTGLCFYPYMMQDCHASADKSAKAYATKELKLPAKVVVSDDEYSKSIAKASKVISYMPASGTYHFTLASDILDGKFVFHI
ncbi:MAG: hypothetical protein IBJ00_07335 [Alphaproteobacteria bacterium]|nr:hypothetical protein [Alphaproteobacteria bacterium]